MKCDKILETMPDLAAGIMAATPEINDHLRSCPACATKLDEMQKTMALLDEWQVPEPSPYFDVRLQAQLREEMAKPATAWFEWLRRPALAVSLTILMAVGVALVSKKTGMRFPIRLEPQSAICKHSITTTICMRILMSWMTCRSRRT